MQGGPVGWPAMGSKPGCGHKPCVEVCPFGTGESLSSLGGGTPSSAVPPRLPPSLSWQFRSLGLPRAGLREEAAVGSASCGMATEGPDLYENLQIRYPHGEQGGPAGLPLHPRGSSPWGWGPGGAGSWGVRISAG